MLTPPGTVACDNVPGMIFDCRVWIRITYTSRRGKGLTARKAFSVSYRCKWLITKSLLRSARTWANAANHAVLACSTSGSTKNPHQLNNLGRHLVGELGCGSCTTRVYVQARVTRSAGS